MNGEPPAFIAASTPPPVPAGGAGSAGLVPWVRSVPSGHGIVIAVGIEQVDGTIAIRIEVPDGAPEGDLGAIIDAIAVRIGLAGIGTVYVDFLSIG